MDTKKCSGCKKIKAVIEFNKNGSGLQTFCRDCNRERSRKYYHNNIEKHRAVTLERSQRLKEARRKLFIETKKRNGCALCNEKEPCCLDFHHLRDKEKDLSAALFYGWSWERLEKEMKKCVVVCANCHRKIHAKLLEVNESMLCVPVSWPRSISSDARNF